jgi:hypothetical protein
LLDWTDREQTTDAQPNAQQTRNDQVPDEIRSLIRENLLDEATRVAMALLHSRIADGDSALADVGLLLQHFYMLIARQPPLSHIDTVQLHPNGHLYECFDRFVDLISQQNKQIGEMSIIISELI